MVSAPYSSRFPGGSLFDGRVKRGEPSECARPQPADWLPLLVRFDEESFVYDLDEGVPYCMFTSHHQSDSYWPVILSETQGITGQALPEFRKGLLYSIRRVA